MNGLDFLAPGRLWLLALPVAALVAYAVQQVRRSGYVLRFSDVSLFDGVAPDRPGWRRHVPAVALTLALTAMVLAYARPALAQRVVSRNAVVVLAIDASRSMEAEDVRPSRITAARRAADAFLAEVPDGVRVGVVTFSAFTRVLVPPVDDVAYAREAVRSFDLEDGTAIGDAVVAAVDAIAALPGRDGAPDASGAARPGAAIVLLSDGETTVGRPTDEGARAAADAGIPVYTVAFGTDAGVIAMPDGERIPVPVNRDALAAVARVTRGQAFEADTARELTQIYERLGRTLTTEEEAPREITDTFAGLALALGVIAGAGSLRWFGRLP